MPIRTGDIIRTGFFTLWGLATLVLVVCIGLLLYGRTEQGDSPLEITFADGPSPTIPEVTSSAPKTTRDVHIYFADRNAMRLEPETHTIPYVEDSIENCRTALLRIIEGPREGLTPVLPPATEIRGMYLVDGGELVVDFSRDLEAGQIKTATAELLMTRAVVATLVQPRLRATDETPIRRVRFLFEGSPPEDRFPAHVDLTEPITLDSNWLPGTSDAADG